MIDIQRAVKAFRFYLRRAYFRVHAIYDPSTDIVLPNGASAMFNTSSGIERWRVETLVGEEETIVKFLDHIQPSDVVYDIGANIGMYACFVATQLDSKDGHLVAVEPHPSNVQRLEENLRNNATCDFSVLESALGDEEGEVKLVDEGDIPGVGTHQINQSGDIKVEQRSVDSLVSDSEIPPPDVVKIDVEGAEARVLEGFGDVLDTVRVLFCEIHPEMMEDFGDDPESLESVLTDAGFSTINRLERGGEYHIIARR